MGLGWTVAITPSTNACFHLLAGDGAVLDDFKEASEEGLLTDGEAEESGLLLPPIFIGVFITGASRSKFSCEVIETFSWSGDNGIFSFEHLCSTVVEDEDLFKQSLVGGTSTFSDVSEDISPFLFISSNLLKSDGLQ